MLSAASQGGGLHSLKESAPFARSTFSAMLNFVSVLLLNHP